ncbi:MAG: sulfotransferase [Myxococcales bacterium]|nr:MAG: sulfotransferase [Myxococcales bacterium]
MIYHFDWSTYFLMVGLAFREENPRVRWRLLAKLFFVVPAVASFHAVCFFLDWVLFPGLRRQELRSPVFIVGHARSGTTLLHRLMSEDRERFSAFLLWELYFPSLLQKKLLRWLGKLDADLLGGFFGRRMEDWDRRKFAATQDIHAMSLFKAEEDDFILTYSCASGWWIVLLPYMGHLDFYYVDEWPERRRRRLMAFYRECVRRELYLNGGDRLHLSKNPTYCGRVESLIEAFPDARIVVTMRNPHETIPSLLKLMKRSWQLRQWSDADMQGSLRILAGMSFHNYQHPLAVLARHPETKHAIVDYRDLVAEPKRVVEEVYAKLAFPVSSDFARTLEQEQQRARTHETSHRYSLEEFGLESSAIRSGLAELFERYQWDEAPASASDRAGEGGASAARDHTDQISDAG